MIDDWTIDTWVLYLAGEANWDSLHFLTGVQHKESTAVFDTEGEIERQYRRCMKNMRKEPSSYLAYRIVERWLVDVVNKGRILKYSGKLPSKHKRKLDKLKFDNDDHAFVGACSRSSSKRLVAEESDYTQEVRQYLEQEMQVTVHSVDSAISELNSASP